MKVTTETEPLIGGPELELHLLAPVLHLGEEGVPLPITVCLHLSSHRAFLANTNIII
jgi:hypothetical protein